MNYWHYYTLYIGNRYNSADKLAGASLACSLINILGQSLIIGVSSSLDTLVGQSFGASLYKMCAVFVKLHISHSNISSEYMYFYIGVEHFYIG